MEEMAGNLKLIVIRIEFKGILKVIWPTIHLRGLVVRMFTIFYDNPTEVNRFF